MSREAIGWLGKQRGLTSGEYRVLDYLCFRHSDEHGCFPKQVSMMDECEMARSTLNSNLKRLEGKGFIRRRQHRNPNTNQQKATHYFLAFEWQTDGLNSRVRKQGTEAKAMSGNEPKPRPEIDQFRVRIPDTNKETLLENTISKKQTHSNLINHFAPIIGEKLGQDVIDHRKFIKKPMSDRAAQLLASKLAKCPSPTEAAELMIERGWQGIEPSWMDNQNSKARNYGSSKIDGPEIVERIAGIISDIRNPWGDGSNNGSHG